MTAGGASLSLPLHKNNGATRSSNNNNKNVKFSSASVATDQAAESGSGSAKAENKYVEPFLPDHPVIQESHSGEGLSFHSQSSNLSYDNEEDHSEMHGLLSGDKEAQRQLDDLYHTQENSDNAHQSMDHDEALNSTGKVIWLTICFFGIMFSFVGYGLLLEYATSGGRKLHELSFLFVTSLLYTCTAAAGRHVRDETPSTIPPARFAVLGVTSMGSTFCSVRSLR